MTIDNELYSRHMAECERQERAEDAVTDEAIGEYIREELLDEFVDEAFIDAGLASFCNTLAPKTYEKARWALVERELEVGR